ncbi:MAG: ATP-binding protein [Nitrospirota bacterium]|mgnify:CR=1 FL=1
MGIKWKLFLAFLLSTTILAFIIIVLSSELPKGLFIASSAIILIISLLINYFVLQRIISPVADIIKGASAISEGNFTHRIRIDTRDELKELSEILNEMSEEFKKRMDEMDEDKARLSTILSTMSEGLLAIDCKGNILLANSVLSEMFGFKGTSVIGRSYLEIIRHNQLNDIIREVLKERQNVIREIEQFFPEERYFAVYASVAEGIKEGGVCAVFIFHDITKIKRLERIRKDFVANVSHELRTPLTSIKGYTEALIDGVIDDSNKAKEFLNIISNHTERLNNILTDLLQLSYIESGQYKPKASNINLRTAVEKAVALLKTNIEKKGFAIDIQVPEGLIVAADEDKLNLAFVNLIDNAIKYTPEKGRIGIKAEARGKEVMVSVSDTGIGIPKEDLARIFERFYRVDKDRSSELGGTGLGLSIVKHIIDAHGGRVWAESELNKGSSFYFTLPPSP